MGLGATKQMVFECIVHLRKREGEGKTLLEMVYVMAKSLFCPSYSEDYKPIERLLEDVCAIDYSQRILDGFDRLYIVDLLRRKEPLCIRLQSAFLGSCEIFYMFDLLRPSVWILLWLKYCMGSVVNKRAVLWREFLQLKLFIFLNAR